MTLTYFLTNTYDPLVEAQAEYDRELSYAWKTKMNSLCCDHKEHKKKCFLPAMAITWYLVRLLTTSTGYDEGVQEEDQTKVDAFNRSQAKGLKCQTSWMVDVYASLQRTLALAGSSTYTLSPMCLRSPSSKGLTAKHARYWMPTPVEDASLHLIAELPISSVCKHMESQRHPRKVGKVCSKIHSMANRQWNFLVTQYPTKLADLMVCLAQSQVRLYFLCNMGLIHQKKKVYCGAQCGANRRTVEQMWQMWQQTHS